MQTINFENVQPLIASTDLGAKDLTFVFQCPASGMQVSAKHTLNGKPDAKAKMLAKAKRSALGGIRKSLTSTVRRAFGAGTVGRMMNDLTRGSVESAAEGLSGSGGPQLSPKQHEEAAVAAFSTVAGQFEWDSGRAGWVSSAAAQELSSPFERMLSEAPIVAPYDKQVAARMLVEVAHADDELEDSELRLLAEFIDPSLGTPEDLAQQPALTAAELGETSSAEVRRTMLTLTWLTALSDDSFEAAEESLIQQFCAGLELDDKAANETRLIAMSFLVDQVLEQLDPGAQPAEGRDQVQQLAQRIGMPVADAQRAEALFHKRRALAHS